MTSFEKPFIPALLKIKLIISEKFLDTIGLKLVKSPYIKDGLKIKLSNTFIVM